MCIGKCIVIMAKFHQGVGSNITLEDQVHFLLEKWHFVRAWLYDIFILPDWETHQDRIAC
jgi:hypothetical protein